MLSLDKIKYIAVDGPIGVGKTSLVQLLADDFQARVVYESPDENPFIHHFYEDISSYAFQTQLFFLLSRYRQQVELKQMNLFEQKIVCDYVFSKDLVFAKLNLSEEEFSLYSQIYHLLDQKLPKPDVVIFLQAQPEILAKRIRKRSKGYEKDITADYLLSVSQAYSQFYFEYNETPLLVVNTSGLDFVKHAKDYEMLKKELVTLIESGQDKHYVTLAPR